MPSALHKTEKTTDGAEGHEKMEAEIGIMQPQAKNYLEIPGDERDKDRFFLRAF